jgi:curved DNA-binding protein CbpA
MSEHFPDLYAILGLTPAATGDEVTRAYRVLLRRHHPDTRPVGDAEQQARSDALLARVLAAYRVLRDPASRADYDRRAGLRARPVTPSGRVRAGASGDPPIVAGPVHWTPPSAPRTGGTGRDERRR